MTMIRFAGRFISIRVCSLLFGVYYFLLGGFGLFSALNGLLIYWSDRDVIADSLKGVTGDISASVYWAALLWMLFGGVMMLIGILQIVSIDRRSEAMFRVATGLLVAAVVALTWVTMVSASNIRQMYREPSVPDERKETAVHLTQRLVFVTGAITGSIAVGLLLNLCIMLESRHRYFESLLFPTHHPVAYNSFRSKEVLSEDII
ncbi:uncharacterized protein LOC129581378 [Paramacrobiotus metropolitanus]|uniref:uncharacterized protein LOC129581378 n=1 Tax=Paramacrobiotus metropolitanus TaxID=2943436 RepID=UPI00244634DE|nr:uncharacterized protein LOC129581378 [Paramacrobiotus metropolitanus]